VLDLVAHDKRGSGSWRAAVDSDRLLREEGIAANIYLFRQHRLRWHSYGCHENYWSAPRHRHTLLWIVVRVVTRCVGRLAKAMERRRIKECCDRTRAHDGGFGNPPDDHEPTAPPESENTANSSGIAEDVIEMHERALPCRPQSAR